MARTVKDFFTDEDFARAFCYPSTSHKVMDIDLVQACRLEANAKLNAFLQCQEKLYGDSRLGSYHGKPLLWSIDEKPESTHECRIVGVEKIEKQKVDK